MKKTSQRGFTLIELLVVIAIIGILASVVLASLNSARTKGADAAIKAGLANLRAQAEIYYDGTGASTYGATGNCSISSTGTVTAITGVCTGLQADTTFLAGLKAVASASGATMYANTTITAPVAWAAYAQLKTTATSWQCVDSTGKAVTLASAPATTVTACP